MTELGVCDCDPEVHDDGSVTHEDDCAAYPWCPHELGVAACLVPCPCPCDPCHALSGAK